MQKKFVIFILGSIIIFYLSTLVTPKYKYQKATSTQNIENQNSQNEKIVSTRESNEEEFKNIIPKNVTFDNGELKIIATNQGGIIKSILIDRFKDNQQTVDLAKTVQQPGKFFGLKLSLEKELDLTNEEWAATADENEIKLEKVVDRRIKITKTIELEKDKYLGSIIIEVTNLGEKELFLKNESLLWGPFEKRGNDTPLVSGYDNKKLTNYHAPKNNLGAQINVEKGWLALKTNYFCMAFFDKQQPVMAEITTTDHQDLLLSLIQRDIVIARGQKHSWKINFYFGPQNYQILKQSGNSLYKIVNFGTFHYIGLAMLFTLNYFYSITKNYGLAIILLTLFIRILLWWPTQRSYTSMKKMQMAMNQMQPRLKTIKEIYRNDPQKLNEETIKLYREYKINPMGGCLPMILQMPILFALWATLSKAVELKGADFFWIWKDLSLKDPIFLFPIVMGVSMFIQQKMSNAPAATQEAAAQQQMMLYFMPIFLTLISLFLPVGVLIYWVVSNIFGIAQQIYINKIAS